MHSYEHILVPTDFSADSDQALLHALALHQQIGSQQRIHLLHVVDGGLSLPLEGASGASLGRKDHERALVQGAKTRLAQQIAQHSASGVRIVSEVRIGAPASHVIATYKDEHDLQVIVVGVQGRGGALRRLVMGSTAQQLIQRAGCPVLVVPCLAP